MSKHLKNQARYEKAATQTLLVILIVLSNKQRIFLLPVTLKAHFVFSDHLNDNNNNPADLTVSKRPGTSYRIEIHFAFFNHSIYLLFSFVKLVETL